MVNKIVIYNPYNNHSVADFYISIVKKAIEFAEIEVEQVGKLQNTRNKNIGIVVTSTDDVFKAKLCGYSPIIVWCQGIGPEESYMRNHSRLRKRILSASEYVGLKNADIMLLVSKSMKEHYEKKYRLNLNNCFIMPCFDTDMNVGSYFTKGKYGNNIFLYAGGLQVWQCFEETALIYKKIEEQIENSHFRVLTKDQDKADTILRHFNIKRYSIDYVDHDFIQGELSKVKFGFCIRKDDPVNNVATPTKLSTYIANGIIPIFTTVIDDFTKKAEKCEYCIGMPSDELDDVTKVVNLCNRTFSGADVLQSFSKAFGEYYSSKFYISQLSDFLKKYL